MSSGQQKGASSSSSPPASAPNAAGSGGGGQPARNSSPGNSSSGYNPSTLLTASRITSSVNNNGFVNGSKSAGKSKKSNDNNSDVGYDDVDLPPIRGVHSTEQQHPEMMTKEEYMARQNEIFEQLTGHASWEAYRDQTTADDAKDVPLGKIIELVMAGLDEEIYNEFREQRYIMDEVECAGDQAMANVVAQEGSNESRNKTLLKNYDDLKRQVLRLEVEFSRMRKQKVDLETDRNDQCNAYQQEVGKRTRLEQICRALVKRVNQLEKEQEELKKVQGDKFMKSHRESIDTLAADIDKLMVDLDKRIDTAEHNTKASQEFKTVAGELLNMYRKRTDLYQEQLTEKDLRYQVYATKSAALQKELEVERTRNKRMADLAEQITNELEDFKHSYRKFFVDLKEQICNDEDAPISKVLPIVESYVSLDKYIDGSMPKPVSKQQSQHQPIQAKQQQQQQQPQEQQAHPAKPAATTNPGPTPTPASTSTPSSSKPQKPSPQASSSHTETAKGDDTASNNNAKVLAPEQQQLPPKQVDQQRAQALQSVLQGDKSSSSGPGGIFQEQFASGLNTAEFFEQTFGFDITGMPFAQILDKFVSGHVNGTCQFDDCPLHGENAVTAQQEWKQFLDFMGPQATLKNNYGPTNASSSNEAQESNNGSLENPPVYGPERPPSMQA